MTRYQCNNKLKQGKNIIIDWLINTDQWTSFEQWFVMSKLKFIAVPASDKNVKLKRIIVYLF